MHKKYWKTLAPLLVIAIVILGFFRYSSKKNIYTVRSDKKIQVSDDSLESYYQKALELRGPQNSSTTAVFLAAGDVMFSRNVAAAILKFGDGAYPFLGMAGVLKSTDFNFGNLETPIVKDAGVVGGHSLIFASPLEYVKKLKDYNFQILNLANNHALDQGLSGLDATKSALDDLKIFHEGAGKNLDEAWKPAVVEANGIKICFVGASYASVNDGRKTKNNYVARIEDLSHLQSAIHNSQLLCNFVIVTMHAGVEYTRTPNQLQTDFAHAAIDHGADVVIGAHPHWVQTIEKYNGKYIFYSLGNFIFDQDFSQDTKEGLTLKINISKANCRPTVDAGSLAPMKCADDLQGSRVPAKLDSIELLPVIISNSQPRPATADETKKILEKIGQKEKILK